jgi:Uma2 family endonuclease
MPPTTTPVTFGDSASLARFSVARYQKMIETGVLTHDDKVELLENYVVLKMTRNPPHDGTIDLMTDTVGQAIPSGWRLRCRTTVVLSDSQPEPDFAIVRGTAGHYLSRHPGAADVGLVIEVADASLLRDQRDKTRIYARANIPCYWVVNLQDMRIEVYTQPSGPVQVPEYGAVRYYQSGDLIPLVLGGVTVASLAVADLLP